MIINSSAGYYLFIPADVNDRKGECPKSTIVFTVRKAISLGSVTYFYHVVYLKSLTTQPNQLQSGQQMLGNPASFYQPFMT